MLKYHEMISRRKTTIAVLRQLLELSVEDFGSLIDKSTSTVNKLETGVLKLSEETASRISQETGVSLYWLMEGDPRKKPYLSFDKRPIPNFAAHSPTAFKFPYDKECFERIQAEKTGAAVRQWFSDVQFFPQLSFITAASVAADWFSVHYAAGQTGRGELAVYLMRKFLKELVERLGKDDKAFLEINSDVRVSIGEGDVYRWEQIGPKGEEYVALVPEPKEPPTRSDVENGLQEMEAMVSKRLAAGPSESHPEDFALARTMAHTLETARECLADMDAETTTAAPEPVGKRVKRRRKAVVT